MFDIFPLNSEVFPQQFLFVLRSLSRLYFGEYGTFDVHIAFRAWFQVLSRTALVCIIFIYSTHFIHQKKSLAEKYIHILFNESKFQSKMIFWPKFEHTMLDILVAVVNVAMLVDMLDVNCNMTF